MTKRYYSVNGEILGDSSSGYYMRDALGSVTGTTSPSTGAVQNTYRYKPYGELLAKSGTSPDPRFQWVGTAGYRQTTISTAPATSEPGTTGRKRAGGQRLTRGGRTSL